MNINRVTLLGNLTRMAEHKTTQTGKTVATFSLATNRKWKTEDGEKREMAEFHNCVAWGFLAERVSAMDSGSLVYVEGRLQTRSWDKADGTKAYKTEVVADTLHLIQKVETPDQAAPVEAAEGDENPAF